MNRKIILLFVMLGLLIAACTSTPGTLKIMTHDSFAISTDVKVAFETQHNITLEFIASGDTGSALNKAILSKGNPIADVFYGVDNTFLSRALDEEIFIAYDSPMLAEIPDFFKLDPQNRALPVDYGDVCLNYDIVFFEGQNVTPPGNLEDLLKPEYRGLLVVENPATSSPGLAFLLATIGHFGEDGYLGYWTRLMDNDTLVVNDWETAYYTEFTRSGGTRPVVVSYASSPPFEFIYADPPLDEPPTAAITTDESCFRQIEYVGILDGTKNLDLAQKWIDFMLSTTFQEDIPLQMFVFPVNQNADLDEAFENYLLVPKDTAFVSPQDIAAKREEWIREWTETVLR
ncbi:MAG: thiamine ABC transporter substrate-binding protein [Chloroflexota bacterium]|nr:thiamine ABC transporter substrate-binding protein [Chloroflexota bacterium]